MILILIGCIVIVLPITAAITLDFGADKKADEYETKRAVRLNREQEEGKKEAEEGKKEAEEGKKEAEEKNNIKQQFFKNELFKNFNLKDDQKEIIGSKLNNFNTENINGIVSYINEYFVLYPEISESKKMKKLLEEISKKLGETQK